MSNHTAVKLLDEGDKVEVDRTYINENGYQVIRGVISDELSRELAAALLIRRNQGLGKNLIDAQAFRPLLFSTWLTRLFRNVIGIEATFHHANGLHMHGRECAKAWHHDFDGDIFQARSFPMFHAMFYPAGINANNGHLVVLPGSHRKRVERRAPHTFGVDSMASEEELTLTNADMVLIHSALWHCRRLGRLATPRPYFNVSFHKPGVLRPEYEQLRSVRCDSHFADSTLQTGR